jgi:hypothetical protein
MAAAAKASATVETPTAAPARLLSVARLVSVARVVSAAKLA